MTDLFLLLLTPGGGDELKGIKKGVTEVSDILLVNKADGDLKAAAQQARADYQSARRLLRPLVEGWRPPVLTCSAHTGDGVADVWEHITDFQRRMHDNGAWARRRVEQSRSWVAAELDALLLNRLRADPALRQEAQ